MRGGDVRRFGMRGWAAVTAAAVTVGLLPMTSVAVAADIKPDRDRLPQLTQPAAVPVQALKAGGTTRRNSPAANAGRDTSKATWPAPGTELLSLPGSTSPAPTRAAKLPVAVAPATRPAPGTAPLKKVAVTFADRAAANKAGIEGPLLGVRRADGAAKAGQARVSMDYSRFRHAFGGNWAARLRLVQMPACVLTTPHKPACRTAKPLPTANDTERGTLSAVAPLAPAASDGASASSFTVLAATAGTSGAAGDFSATSLEASGAWSAGGATGAFTWNYPINVPGVPGGLQPSVSLGYNSQAVDGRTAATNNQGGWIGDGWSYEPGYIERRYKPCNDDKSGGTNTTKVGDLCWYNDNATLSLGGKTTELVYDSAKGWHPTADSGEKIEKLTGADNGDKGTAGVDGAGEHWKVTTPDGTQYFFGRHKLPGWGNNGTAADDPVTNSTLNVPVFGNQTGEPCYNASFASAWCLQAWRWNLDYVVDPRGNAMAYYWKKELNHYGRNVSETTGASTSTVYSRGSYLNRIEYGLQGSDAHAAKAMGKVTFGVDERCLADCGTFDAANAANWPDVPYDLYCKDAATECKDMYSPSFWSRKRLTSITTQVLTDGAYKNVDTWTLQQSFPASGDGISTPMWLESIVRTGEDGTATSSVPPIRFAWQQKHNRVDKLGDGLAPFIRMRMSQITTETGGTIGIDYLDPNCTATSLPPTDDTNGTRCYPVKWAFEGQTAKQDWFNSYVVQRVIEGDNVLATPDVVTEYGYVGDAEWAKSEDEFAKAENRTYSVPRGYYLVQTRTGAGTQPRTLSETRYFRGIDGAKVLNSNGVAFTDRVQFAGMKRDEATYNGDGGALVSATSYRPWRSAATASRARTGLPALEAYLTGIGREETRTTVTGGTRTIRTDRTFDSYGMVHTVSELGDLAKTGDEKCTTTTYARNSATWMLGKVSRSETVAAACTETVSRPADVIDDIRTYYDNAALGAAPVTGLVTKTERINADGTGYQVTSSTPSICGTTGDELCYDIYGRQLAEADAYGKVSRSSFTPATGEVPTTTVVTNPLGHAVTSVLEPRRAQPVKITDANGKITTTSYDPLGRVTKAWLPTRSATLYPTSPSYEFSYLVRTNGPIVTTTRALTHDSQYKTSYTFQDGLLRSLQTQEESPDRAGRLVTETFYNSRGEATVNSGTYFTTGAPSSTAVTGQQTMYPSSTELVYDGAGRPTAAIAKRFTDETKRTTTTYNGDTTTVVPPQGAVATTTVVDALNRTTELKQYTNTARTASQSTRFLYDAHGRLKEVTDPSGATWSYKYDVRGRQVEATDPDKGTVTTVYDQGDRPTDVSDARGVTLHTDYDELGRPKARKSGSSTLAAWVYDTVAKGQLSKTTRYNGAYAYTTETTAYNSFYQPLTTKVTIPATEGALAGTYQWATSYNTTTGQVLDIEHPEMADLPAEVVTNGYTAVTGLPDTLMAGDDPLISDTTYDHYGRATRLEYGSFGRHIWTTAEYDDHTNAVTRAYTDRDTAPQRIEDTRYTYDPAGNITQIAAAYGQDATRTTDTQCFQLDALRRITQAWTNSGETCATAPSATVVGGPEAYWTTYAYDAVGNRKTETQHKTAGGPAADTIRTYADPAAGKHNLPSVTQTGSDPRTETYTYDSVGNTKTRKIGNADLQTFDWDDEGHLKSVTKVTDTTSYLYDPDGQRLIRRDTSGTTLYLPGGNELHLNKAGTTVTATRYYGSTAMRTGGKLTFLLADHHGTGTTQITNDATQAISRRKTTIFGAPRGTQPTNWRGDKGFVGGTKDPDTTLTHLGAREYDPNIGRFISVDPVLDFNDPQQTHGYTYGNNNPVAFSDPTGLRPDGPVGGADYNDKRETKGAGHYNGSTGSGWFKDHAGGWSYRYKQNVGGFTASQTIWSDRASSRGYKKHASVNVVKNPPPPKNFYQKYIGPVLGSVILPDPQAWQDCFGDGSIQQCAWAATDLPFLKPFKALKAVKKLDESAETTSDATRKPGCPEHSFLPGTKVLLTDGTTKSIEDIREGDKVLATDPDTGETRGQDVVQTIITKDDKEFTELTIKAGNGNASIVATDTHPFWSTDQNKWIDAGDVTPGTTLRTTDERGVQVLAVRHYKKQQRTHDLTIDRIHTYYVMAGATPVLVHNSNCPTFWSRTDYNGQRIYQRDDLVNPDYFSPADKYGRSNLKRMQQGLAPMGPDGKPLNLHHMLQTQDGPIAEVTHSMHFGNYNQLHWKAGTKIPSGIDRDAFNAWKSQYWKDRAAGFGG
ncbi:HNH/ENDO VII family nuclease [Streptomyces purpureus]|uniref:HNH/ENDO VII family nuclease n=1 Tax=Streptomyces purpureus TaxID=1951 RepID=UPI0037B20089